VLPQGITESIESLKREAFWPNWFAGEKMKGEAAARRCLAIGKEWNLEESEAYHNALATIEGGSQSGYEFQSNAHNSIIMFLLTASASKNVYCIMAPASCISWKPTSGFLVHVMSCWARRHRTSSCTATTSLLLFMLGLGARSKGHVRTPSALALAVHCSRGSPPWM